MPSEFARMHQTSVVVMMSKPEIRTAVGLLIDGGLDHHFRVELGHGIQVSRSALTILSEQWPELSLAVEADEVWGE